LASLLGKDPLGVIKEIIGEWVAIKFAEVQQIRQGWPNFDLVLNDKKKEINSHWPEKIEIEKLKKIWPLLIQNARYSNDSKLEDQIYQTAFAKMTKIQGDIDEEKVESGDVGFIAGLESQEDYNNNYMPKESLKSKYEDLYGVYSAIALSLIKYDEKFIKHSAGKFERTLKDWKTALNIEVQEDESVLSRVYFDIKWEYTRLLNRAYYEKNGVKYDNIKNVGLSCSSLITAFDEWAIFLKTLPTQDEINKMDEKAQPKAQADVNSILQQAKGFLFVVFGSNLYLKNIWRGSADVFLKQEYANMNSFIEILEILLKKQPKFLTTIIDEMSSFDVVKKLIKNGVNGLGAIQKHWLIAPLTLFEFIIRFDKDGILQAKYPSLYTGINATAEFDATGLSSMAQFEVAQRKLRVALAEKK